MTQSIEIFNFSQILQSVVYIFFLAIAFQTDSEILCNQVFLCVSKGKSSSKTSASQTNAIKLSSNCKDKSTSYFKSSIIYTSTSAIRIVFICKMSLLIGYISKKVQVKKKKLKQLKNEFENGDPEMMKNLEIQGGNVHLFPFKKEFEISGHDFSIDRDKILGDGEFYTVKSGKLREFDVAIKTTKSTEDLDFFKAFLYDLKVMTFIDKHPNVVQLLGTSTNRIREQVVHVIVELSIHGNLHSFLKEQHSNVVDTLFSSQLFDVLPEHLNNSTGFSAAPSSIKVTTLDLIIWCGQVAAGMAHLASKKVLHGNLAASNILLFDDYTAKITDVGLSRQLYRLTSCIKNKEPPLCWRNLAPETLKDQQFTTKSDVWSFGVLMWEIFSLASVPYSKMGWTLGFLRRVKNGLRLQKPRLASNEIYQSMQRCWNVEPEARPSFLYLERLYSDMIRHSSQSDRIYITRM